MWRIDRRRHQVTANGKSLRVRPSASHSGGFAGSPQVVKHGADRQNVHLDHVLHPLQAARVAPLHPVLRNLRDRLISVTICENNTRTDNKNNNASNNATKISRTLSPSSYNSIIPKTEKNTHTQTTAKTHTAVYRPIFFYTHASPPPLYCASAPPLPPPPSSLLHMPPATLFAYVS